MNRTFKAAVAALMLAGGFAGSVTAEPMEDVAAAFKKGDYATAVRLMRPLAEQGAVVPQVMLGQMYEHGSGVPQDHAIAVLWYRAAAEQDNAAAQHLLGLMYAEGRGVPQDYVIAHMWLNLAAARSFSFEKSPRLDFIAKGMVEARDMVAKHMTPAQIAEAQKLAREWKPK
jgi:uncharacterized protein